jgi:mannose-6-phosphate isomerase-like protein (cupin superfamily)
MKQRVHSIDSDFVVLSPDKRATIETADAGLYERLDTDYGGFSGHELIACHTFDEDWPTWEIHPHGDEIVILLSGDTTLVLQQDHGEHRVRLSEPGAYVIVPRNTWHTARTSATTKMLFITPGEGTENRPV